MPTDLSQFIVSVLVTSGVGIAIVVFLSKKLLDHLLKKDIEKFKSDAVVYQKLEGEKKIYAFNEELSKLKEIWDKIGGIVDICGSYSGNVKELNNSVSLLEEFIDKNEPYVNSDIIRISRKIIILTDPDSYKKEQFSELLNLKKELINQYRVRHFLH